MNMKNTYKFSIVSAVYNTAEYLDEMIKSVINQDIGFEENVQLILVNDGSEDNSLEICRRYEKKYPKNIIVIDIANRGVSGARNEGLKKAIGQYVNFLDSDDQLENSVLSKVYKMFKEYKDVIDVVSIPLYFFGCEEGSHILNYKFKSKQIIDITKEYKSIQLSASSSFISREHLRGHYFDEKLAYAEDAKFMSEIILKKNRYGVLPDTKYYYRRRYNKSSAVQQGHLNKAWYLEYIKNFSKELIQNPLITSSNKKYIQYLIMYDLQWRINTFRNIKDVIDKEELKEFFQIFLEIMKQIKMSKILEQKNLKWERKGILLLVKYSDSRYIESQLIKLLMR